jgi:hypothetical protein
VGSDDAHLSIQMEGDESTSRMYDVRRLMAAIVERAFEDLTDSEFVVRSEAMAWFNSRRVQEKHYIFNFQNICALLELEPEPIIEKAMAKYLLAEADRKAAAEVAKAIAEVEQATTTLNALDDFVKVEGKQLTFSLPLSSLPELPRYQSRWF